MLTSVDLLKNRYLSHIKPDPSLLIGVELEFPIVEKMGNPTSIKVTTELMKTLAQSMVVEKIDEDGNPIQLLNPETGDRILFEVSYTTIEFAFAPVSAIHEVEKRFLDLFDRIQEILEKNHHEIQGWGVNPNWQINDNHAVKSPRYEMLMSYLSLALNKNHKDLHDYYDYGSFICGSQVQLDVSRENYLHVINAFNQLEPLKAFLFANSEFWGQDWDLKISRDFFWEGSMHGIFKENVGVNPVDFKTEDEFFTYLDQSAIFTAKRGEKTYFFEPIRATDYLDMGPFEAYDLNGNVVLLEPEVQDFDFHRSYQYQDLTTRGTVEFRSVCTQPLDRTFAPAAFHLGLLVVLEEVEKYLESCPFFLTYGRNYPALRRQFSKKLLTEKEKLDMEIFATDILRIAYEGLLSRGLGEEQYLRPLCLGRF
ncbi:hypothetical protein STRDD10_00726 [Streptococcus sp. DD10]|uniref:glutamate-cysteine ligase family protein n=1 Tax=Streptococcus sp. DD10 TaxID=1777878 RepID=UPI000795DF5B|nr:glutamate-cysteine ligase family protein [Streptococcus sp. DD10]KXT74780.1 hypothetical protein STRDD10_00726 [Streptococcus sp. DD10]